ncbi:MAG: NAD(P)H-hydrate dehydratase [Deltaproteobacteria bacterium]|nr:NAD(P)H-hydrate dehydratase [Deltaproteobacteria bacterium]
MLVTLSKESRQLDRIAMEDFGLPGLVLMENAARSIFREALAFWPALANAGRKIVILGGPGQNGGDGWVLARLFSAIGHRVFGYLITKPGHRPGGDAAVNYALALKLGLPIEVIESDSSPLPDFSQADLLIDAVFGTGLDRPLSGPAARVLTAASAYKRQYPQTGVLAVDLPSGLSGDTGSAGPEVVPADLTVTLASFKLGLFLKKGPSLAGTVKLGDIGLCPPMIERLSPRGRLLDLKLAAAFLPPRPLSGHKGLFGHAVVCGGSTGKTGALALAALGAQRSGCGLITAAHPASLAPVLATKLTGAMTLPLPEESDGQLGEAAASALTAFMENCRALGLGPGLGLGGGPKRLTGYLSHHLPKPMVLDADALTNLAKPSSQGQPNELLTSLTQSPSPRVLTPHPGEAGRLLGVTPAQIEDDRFTSAINLAQLTKSVVVLKGRHTLIVSPDNHFLVNTSGGPILATGGSGDVLTGLLTGLLAQGMAPFEAAGLAVFVHGRAGDLAALRLGPIGVTPDEIGAFLPLAWAELTEAKATSLEGGY